MPRLHRDLTEISPRSWTQVLKRTARAAIEGVAQWRGCSGGGAAGRGRGWRRGRGAGRPHGNTAGVGGAYTACVATAEAERGYRLYSIDQFKMPVSRTHLSSKRIPRNTAPRGASNTCLLPNGPTARIGHFEHCAHALLVAKIQCHELLDSYAYDQSGPGRSGRARITPLICAA